MFTRYIIRARNSIKDFDGIFISAELSDPCTTARQFTECFWMNHQVFRFIP